MERIIRITHCTGCPHMSSYIGLKCNHPDHRFSKNLEDKDIKNIPDWCPLEIDFDDEENS